MIHSQRDPSTTTPASAGVADYLLASKRCDLLGLELLLGAGQLVAAISNLVHALQLERGASNMFLGSDGQRCAEVRQAQIDKARTAEAVFRASLSGFDVDSHCTPGASRLFNRIAGALYGLDELSQVRVDIDQLKPKPSTIIDGYGQLIQSLLAIVFETADSASDPDISRTLVAMFHLMQGKEFAGQERAVGSAGFAQGNFDQGFSRRLRHLIDNQERCFQIFFDFADSEALDAWQQTVSVHQVELERFRRIAFAAVADGVADRDLSDAWFACTSTRINAMKTLEDTLELSLTDLCQRKIKAARSDLKCHKVQIDQLSQTRDTGAMAVFFSRDSLSGLRDSAPHAYDTGYAGAQLGRSLFELVQSQAIKLQAMGEELQQARAALEERKCVEKAKGMLMRCRDLSEDEAYRFLRKVAMAQNRRLADVAKDTLAMEDLFTAKT